MSDSFTSSKVSVCSTVVFPSQDSPMAKLRFLVSLITKDNDYQREQAAAATSAGAEFGVDIEIVYAENDAITQSTQLLKVIQADPSLRPNAIVVEPLGVAKMNFRENWWSVS